jgi:hypothetical protein
MASVERVRADLARKQKAIEAGKGISQPGQEEFIGKEIPGLLNSKITLAKSVLNALKNGNQKDFDAKVSELMLDPQKLADFLEYIPKKDTENITASMMAKMSPEPRKSFKDFIKAAMPAQTEITRGIISSVVSE